MQVISAFLETKSVGKTYWCTDTEEALEVIPITDIILLSFSATQCIAC